MATDIAARGLDIDMLPNVVNFELPNVPEDYVHRIGRTARAGLSGKAVSLVCIDEIKLLKDIERLISRELPRVRLNGFEPDPTIKAEPIRQGRQQGPQGGGRGRGGPGGSQGRSHGRGPRAPGGNNAGGQAASSNRRSRARSPSGRTA